MSILELMAAPFAECMILVAIHTYLGIHVLRRRVIFVDLALAQTAALGTTVGFLFGIMPASPASLVFSMTFTFLAAAVFALTRIRSDRIPQEAVIGLFYAIAAAMAVLVVEKTKGSEHMESILVGGLLWVKWADVLTAAIAYSIIGIVHWRFRRQFRLISERPDEAYESGMNVRAWDFLFYLTFGLVISFSVRVAGVLLVFVFLVAPAIMAFLITMRMRYQLLIGWVTGTIVTGLGLLISYLVDLPSGPTIVSFYGVVLVVGALAIYLIRAERKMRTLGVIVAGVGVAVVVVLGVWAEGTLLAGSCLANDEEVEVIEEMARAEHDCEPDDRHRKEQGEEIGRLREMSRGIPGDGELLRYVELDDSDSRLEFIRVKIERDSTAGLALIVCFLSDPETGSFFRSEAIELLEGEVGESFGFDPARDPDGNSEPLMKMRKMLEDRVSTGRGQRRRHRHREGRGSGGGR